MKTSECDLVFVPGLGNSGPDHWQTRWQQKLSSSRRVEQTDWDHPKKQDWVARVVETLETTRKPTVVIAHSLGVLAAAAALPAVKSDRVKGAFFVCPPGKPFIISCDEIDHAFARISHDPLPVPSVLVASRDAPCCPWLDAEELAFAWGSSFIDAGHSGHINTDSGHGPCPEGLMRFAGFMAKL